MINEEQCRYIITKHPHTHGSNTEFIISFLEEACQYRKLDLTWENIRALMREFKPESITRARRKFIEATDEQLDKEKEMREKFSPDKEYSIDEIAKLL